MTGPNIIPADADAGRPRRVVITGKGFFTPLGHDDTSIMAGFDSQKSLYKSLDFAPDIAAARIWDFDLKAVTGRYKNARYLNRGAALALAAGIRAVENAGLNKEERARAGLFTGAGPNMDIGGEILNIRDSRIDPKGMSALWLLRFLPNTAAATIADRCGIHGENLTLSTACATGIQAVGEAFRRIRTGYLDAALAGSGDSRINPGGVMAYQTADALCTGPRAPATRHRPFDRDRAGFAMGEGAAFFVLESLDHARARSARILAEITGFGSSMDGSGMTAPDPSGKWMEQAVRKALKESGLSGDRVDAVSSHGTGTDLNDAMEAALLSRVFGKHRPAVTALKSWTGHTSAACGAVELALMLILMDHGFLPRINNLDHPIAPDLDLVRKNRKQPFRTVLLENFGFGGQNGALVMKKWISA